MTAGVRDEVEGAAAELAKIFPSEMNIATCSPVSTTDPAPLVLALTACHVHAPLVFLNGHVALGTSLEFNGGGPVVEQLNLGVVTGFPLVPRCHEALEAEGLLTCGARNVGGILRSGFHYDILTLGVWTVLLGIACHHLLVGTELLKLRESLFVNACLYEFIRNALRTSLLGTFNKVATRAALGDFKGQELLV